MCVSVYQYYKHIRKYPQTPTFFLPLWDHQEAVLVGVDELTGFHLFVEGDVCGDVVSGW